MADIFISYSSKDKVQAQKLFKRLSEDGYSCWIDESGINAAEKWSSEIVQAIEACKIFIILLSHASLTSHNVIKELSLASEEKKSIIPVALESVNLTHDVKYQLAGLQKAAYKDYDRIAIAIDRLLKKPLTENIPSRRRLLAVMFTDIKGYSKITNTNESLAVEILNFYNSFMHDAIERGNGRVVDNIGDGVLAVFESAIRAVETGMLIQDKLRNYNDARPEEKRFQIRMGIHMGDIIEEGEKIRGDAVNIASRIQSIAPPSQVAVSETIYAAVKRKMPLKFISLGEKRLKNIQEPYTIYVVEKDSGTDEVHSSPQKNLESVRRLAVIPFDDLSPAHDNEAFSDGLTDELISTLNKLDRIFVLDRQTSKMYKGVKMTAKQIADELEVRYIITGGVRKQDNNIRIQATLIDTNTGKTLWDERFSGTMDNIFEIQEKTAKDIAAGLKLQLSPAENELLRKKITENAEAYELYLKASAFYNRHTKQDFQYALQLSEAAVKLDPSFAGAYALIAQLDLELYRLYNHTPDSLKKAEHAALKALKLDPSLPDVYQALSELALQKGSPDEAIRYAKKEEEFGTMTENGYAHLGFIFMETNHPAEAAYNFEQSLQLHMNDLLLHYNLCLQYEKLGDRKKLHDAAMRALPYYEKYLRNHPDDQAQRMFYAALLEYSGNRKKSLTETESIASFPNADGFTLYNAACIFLRNDKVDEGLLALKRAVAAGFSAINSINSDPDLDAVRNTPEFRKIMKKLEAVKH